MEGCDVAVTSAYVNLLRGYGSLSRLTVAFFVSEYEPPLTQGVLWSQCLEILL